MIDWLLTIPSGLVVLVIGASIFAESAFVPALVLPGTTAVLSMGVVVGLGIAPAPIGYGVAVLAAVAGTGVSWRTGAAGGPALRASAFGERVGPQRWDRADALVAERGRSAIAAGQFVVISRTLVPLLSGMAGTSYRRFASVSIPAATLWAAGLTAIGQAAGANYERVQAALGDATASVAVIAVLTGVIVWAGRWVSRNPSWATRRWARAPRLPFQRLRDVVDGTTEWVAPVRTRSARRRILVAGTLWWLLAVAISVAIMFVVSLALDHAGLAALDDRFAVAVAEHSSTDLVALAQTLSSRWITLGVLLAFYLLAGLGLASRRHPMAAAARLRVFTTLFGLTAFSWAAGLFGDVSGHARFHQVFGTVFDRPLAVISCTLILFAVLAAHRIDSRRHRIALATTVAVLVMVGGAAHVISARATLSDMVAGLVVGAVWALFLTSTMTRTPGP